MSFELFKLKVPASSVDVIEDTDTSPLLQEHLSNEELWCLSTVNDAIVAGVGVGAHSGDVYLVPLEQPPISMTFDAAAIRALIATLGLNPHPLLTDIGTNENGNALFARFQWTAETPIEDIGATNDPMNDTLPLSAD